MAKSTTDTSQATAPGLRDFRFVIWLDPKSPSRPAVGLLAEYAANAVNFLNDRQNRYAVESLANARKFAEYVVTYVEAKENISYRPPPGEESSDSRKGKFARRLDHIATARPDLAFPHGALMRVWRDAGDAVHPPDGVSENDIAAHKHNYQVKAGGALRDALVIAEWLKARYGTMSWFARQRHRWRSRKR